MGPLACLQTCFGFDPLARVIREPQVADSHQLQQISHINNIHSGTKAYCSWSLFWTNANKYNTFGFSTLKFVLKELKMLFNLYLKVLIYLKNNLQILPLCFPSQFCFLRQQKESSLDLLGLPGSGIHLSSYLTSWRYWVVSHQRPVHNSQRHDKMPHPNFEIFLVQLCPISGNNKMYFILLSKTVCGTIVKLNLSTSQGCSKENT